MSSIRISSVCCVWFLSGPMAAPFLQRCHSLQTVCSGISTELPLGCVLSTVSFFPSLLRAVFVCWFQVIFRWTTGQASSPQLNPWIMKMWPAMSSGSRRTRCWSSCQTCAFLPKVRNRRLWCLRWAVRYRRWKRCFMSFQVMHLYLIIILHCDRLWLNTVCGNAFTAYFCISY